MQAGAVDDEFSGKIPHRSFDPPAFRRGVQTGDARAGADVRAGGLEAAAHRGGDGGVIHDPLLRHPQRGQAGGVGLDLAQRGGFEPAQPAHAVGGAALFELAQTPDLGGVRGHDDFSANFMRDPFLAAKGDHPPDAAHRQAGLERAGFVI